MSNYPKNKRNEEFLREVSFRKKPIGSQFLVNKTLDPKSNEIKNATSSLGKTNFDEASDQPVMAQLKKETHAHSRHHFEEADAKWQNIEISDTEDNEIKKVPEVNFKNPDRESITKNVPEKWHFYIDNMSDYTCQVPSRLRNYNLDMELDGGTTTPKRTLSQQPLESLTARFATVRQIIEKNNFRTLHELRRVCSLTELDYLKDLNVHVDLEFLSSTSFRRPKSARKVSFSADVFIKMFPSSELPPEIPASAYNDLAVNPIVSGFSRPIVSDSEWRPLFVNPCSLPNFTEKVVSKKVQLEQVYCAENAVYFSVRVMNLAFHKNVQIFYTYDEWKSTRSITLVFREQLPSLNQDVFSGFIKNVGLSQKLEFYVCYEVNGEKYFDSYDNYNYVLTLMKTSFEL